MRVFRLNESCQDPRTNPKSLVKLLAECEKIKTSLTPAGIHKQNRYCEMLMGGIDFKMDLSLETFDELCAPLVARLEACVHRALDAFQARLGADACADRAAASAMLKAVEIVGGPSRFRGTPDCNESAALHNYGPDAHCR